MKFRNYVFSNFPFLENDFDALTDYELFSKMVCYMKKALDQLKNYDSKFEDFNERLTEIETYLKTLDIQDEVNNKLDEMYDNGQLQSIIEEFLDLEVIFTFDTVSDLQDATNLIDGCHVKTLGFYNINDNGGSLYLVRNRTNEDIIDNKYIIGLYDDTLIAELIIKSEMNLNQTGVTSEDNASVDLNILIGKSNVTKIAFDYQTTYNFETTINLNKKIELEFNNATCYYNGVSDYMFNITTNYANKPTINNLKIRGNDTNGFIYAQIGGTSWGVSYILKNSKVDKFLHIITAHNIFNAIHDNVLFNSDYGYITITADDMSNDNLFINCYFKGFNITYANYPDYKFVFTNVKNMKFICCAIEHCKGVFNLVSGNRQIVLSNCEIEQFDKVANTYSGLIIDGTNMLIGDYVYSDDINYKVIPRSPLIPVAINLGDVSPYNLRNTVLTNASGLGASESTYVENTNGNTARLYNFTNKEWNLYLPFNIIQNNIIGNTSLSTNVSSIFSEQNGEATIVTIYTRIKGSDGSRKFFRDTFICENISSIRKQPQDELAVSVWDSSAIPSNATVTNSLTATTLTTTSSVSCDIDVRIKFEKLGTSY